MIGISYNVNYKVNDHHTFYPLEYIWIPFAIIQSTFYRLIKGQQYLKKMYEINCDDYG